MHNLIGSLLIILLLVSCSTEKVDYHVPTSMYLTPEVKGQTLKGNVSIGFGSDHKVIIAESYDSSFITNTSATIDTEKNFEESAGVSAKLELGLWKFIDLFVRGLNEAPTMFGANIQLIGKPESESSAGWKLSIAGSYGEDSQKEDSFTLQSSNLNSELEDISSTIYLRAKEIGLLVGHRFSDSVLTYLSAMYTEYDVSGSMSIGSKNYGLEDTSRSQSFNLGLKFSVSSSKALKLYLLGEGGYSKIEHHSIEQTQSGGQFNLAAGISW